MRQQNLPHDVIYLIAHYADAPTVISICLTSKSLHRMIYNSPSVWEALVTRVPEDYHFAPFSIAPNDPDKPAPDVSDYKQTATRPFRLERALTHGMAESTGLTKLDVSLKTSFIFSISHPFVLRWRYFLPGGRWALTLSTVGVEAGIRLECWDLVSSANAQPRILNSCARYIYEPFDAWLFRHPCVQLDPKTRSVNILLSGKHIGRRGTIMMEIIRLTWSDDGEPELRRHAVFPAVKISEGDANRDIWAANLGGDYVTLHSPSSIWIWNWRDGTRGLIRGTGATDKAHIRYAHFQAPFLCFGLAGGGNTPQVRRVDALPPISETTVKPAKTRAVKVWVPELDPDGTDADMPIDDWLPPSAREGDTLQIIPETRTNESSPSKATGLLFGIHRDRKKPAPYLVLADKRALSPSLYPMPNFGISKTFKAISANNPDSRGNKVISGKLIGPPFQHPAPGFYLSHELSEVDMSLVNGMCAALGTFFIDPQQKGFPRIGNVECRVLTFD